MIVGRIAGTALLAAILAGCSTGQPIQPFVAGEGLPAKVASHTMHAASTYRLLYAFGTSSADGHFPGPSLIDVNGTLYGVTGNGPGSQDVGNGTVFSITPSGKEKVLHVFGAVAGDAEQPGPPASLLNLGGTLYGTGVGGGAYDTGALYSITPTGEEHVVFSFGKEGASAGVAPYAGLINVGRNLYGTTIDGGKFSGNGGTVFSVSTAGKWKLLHSFGKGNDGASPICSLIDVNGTLYGTTSEGGTYGYGIVFSMSPGGAVRVLHSFGNGSDGRGPQNGGLLDVNGTLYGTTVGGGKYRHDIQGGGTVFSISLTGTEKVLYSFGKGSDGYAPYGSLIDVNGTLYGTTKSGGLYGKNRTSGYDFAGTVYSITLSGSEKVLHSFANGTDGIDPQNALVDLNGTLYGTTTWGGKFGWGTVFTLTLPH
jgi:uncharacterized repeat protein (TIGR03803 family)